ncbi:MAG: PKD domain-containing protein, partial [Acidobacteriota bacterium]|nr:PKD domain-containing protein [Acidobacteriota bacterium]
MVSRLAAFAVLSAALGTACTESALPEDATLPTGETNRQPIAPATTPDRDLPPTRLGKISDDIGQRFGDGFLVWESNRTGSWRIWIRRLDGSGLRQLSPDEKGRQHCCAHIAPGGGAIAYVSMATGRRAFAGPDEFGELHVISADGSSDRIIAVDAHTYYENRAAVWQSPSKLVYIGSERQTYMLDLASGQRAVLVRSPEEGFGRLLDATLGYATRGVPSFDVYLEKPRTVAPRRGLGGCQPYFSHDGRWGFWTAGGGGPFKRYDLETSAVTTLLKKGDERLPPDRGYIYFPMYSRDSRMIAFSASPGEHSHFTADYEVFVAESDPATLEILERPVRMTFDPGTDRFPDVFQVSLPLGRHTGEAPFTVRVRPPDGDTWEWTFGDGDSAAGAGAEHSYENPGAYQLLASRGDVILEGRVIVQPARPPRVLGTDIRDGRELFVRFDESVRLDNPQVRFEPRRSVRTVDVGEDGRSVRIELDEPFRGFGRMQLSGVTDAAEQPNAMSPVSLEIEPPVWPSRREGLVFLWTAGDAPNLVDDTDLGASRACSLEAHGVARLDRDFAMQADGGTFSAGVEAGGYVIRRSQATNEITLEMMLTPRGKVSDSLGV